MEGPLCPSLMEIQSSARLRALWVMPPANPPKWTIMCLQSRRVKRPQMEIGIGGRDALIQLGAVVTRAQTGNAYFCAHTCAHLCMHLP